LMNEMGLTARSRFAKTKMEDDSPAAKFLRGVKG
jgi:hypothetical protein